MHCSIEPNSSASIPTVTRPARLATKALRAKAAALVAEWAKTPLMLPAPAITFEFPGINALPTRSVETREAVRVNAK